MIINSVCVQSTILISDNDSVSVYVTLLTSIIFDLFHCLQQNAMWTQVLFISLCY